MKIELNTQFYSPFWSSPVSISHFFDIGFCNLLLLIIAQFDVFYPKTFFGFICTSTWNCALIRCIVPLSFFKNNMFLHFILLFVNKSCVATLCLRMIFVFMFLKHQIILIKINISPLHLYSVSLLLYHISNEKTTSGLNYAYLCNFVWYYKLYPG